MNWKSFSLKDSELEGRQRMPNSLLQIGRSLPRDGRRQRRRPKKHCLNALTKPCFENFKSPESTFSFYSLWRRPTTFWIVTLCRWNTARRFWNVSVPELWYRAEKI